MAVTLHAGHERLNEARELFGEYADSLGFELDFQNFERELAELPGRYALPSGRLYLAEVDGQLAGCMGLRELDSERCEIKRLYVRPQFRGNRIGNLLLEQVLADARAIGYRQVLLDTLPSMRSAVRLYEQAGFRSIEPYYDNPMPDARYFCLDLAE